MRLRKILETLANTRTAAVVRTLVTLEQPASPDPVLDRHARGLRSWLELSPDQFANRIERFHRAIEGPRFLSHRQAGRIRILPPAPSQRAASGRRIVPLHTQLNRRDPQEWSPPAWLPTTPVPAWALANHDTEADGPEVAPARGVTEDMADRARAMVEIMPLRCDPLIRPSLHSVARELGEVGTLAILTVDLEPDFPELWRALVRLDATIAATILEALPDWAVERLTVDDFLDLLGNEDVEVREIAARHAPRLRPDAATGLSGPGVTPTIPSPSSPPVR